MGELSRAVARVGLGAAKLEQVLELPEGPLHAIAVPGKDAVAAWRKLRAAVTATKHWPVLLGPRDEVPRIEEMLEAGGDESASAILKQASGFLAGDVLLTLARGRKEREETAEPEYPGGPWPEEARPHAEWTIPEAAEVLVGLLPTESGWQMPAYLRFGGWNDCPPPRVHVALLKHWHEQFGAEVVGATHDTLELAVARPPQDRAAALVLAKQHYDYCCDVVDQGVDSIEALAAGLLGGSVWYFWWD
jgi:hypothetical protein